MVRAGNQKLDGAAAAAYATYLADGEPEQARLARFDDVLDWRASPACRRTAPSRGHGPGRARRRLAVHRWTPPRWPRPWRAARPQPRRALGGSDVLPVNEIDTGGSVPAVLRDRRRPGGGGDALAASRGRCRRTPPARACGCWSRTASGPRAWCEQARTKLVDDGFRFINGGNAASFGVDESAGADPRRHRRRAWSGASGWPSRWGCRPRRCSLRTAGQTVADVIVILGEDFAP